MTKQHVVIEATITNSLGAISKVNLVNHEGKLIAELDPNRDPDQNNHVGPMLGKTRDFSRFISLEECDKIVLEYLGNVTRGMLRRASSAEIAAQKSVAYWQLSSIGSNQANFTKNWASHPAEFINDSGLEFQDISSEAERVYNFGGKGFVKIKNPLQLNVSSSGGHRLFSADGQSHYVPSGWIELTWTAKVGQSNFVK